MNSKTLIFWMVILVAAILLWQVVKSSNTSSRAPIPEISYSQFLSQVEAGDVTKVTIAGTTLNGSNRDGSHFRVIVPASQQQMLEALQQKNVEIWFSPTEQSTTNWLVNLAPLALLAALWFFMIRQMRSAAKARSDSGAASSSAAAR